MKWKRVRKFGFPTKTWYTQGKSNYAVIECHGKSHWFYGVFSGQFESRPHIFSRPCTAPNKQYAKHRAALRLEADSESAKKPFF